MLNFLTGYADDLTLHRTIRSERDLRAIHRLITSLLEEVKAHKLVVNQSKCVIVAKLATSSTNTRVGSSLRREKKSKDGALAATRHFLRSSGFPPVNILGHDFLWPLRTSNSSLPHWRGQTETAPGSAVCVQSKSSKHESPPKSLDEHSAQHAYDRALGHWIERGFCQISS